MKMQNMFLTMIAGIALGCAATPNGNGGGMAPATTDQTNQTNQPQSGVQYATLDAPGEVKIVDDKTLPQVVLKTAKGNVLIELYEDNTPNTVANFIYLVEQEHYRGSNFHRVIPLSETRSSISIIQGGVKGGKKSPAQNEDFDWTIKNERIVDSYGTLSNKAGTIAMARLGNDIDSAGCQFYINMKDAPSLDSKGQPYCVFGRVTEGMSVVESIAQNDAILDAWVLQKRNHPYIPVVRLNGSKVWGSLK